MQHIIAMLPDILNINHTYFVVYKITMKKEHGAGNGEFCVEASKYWGHKGVIIIECHLSGVSLSFHIQGGHRTAYSQT